LFLMRRGRGRRWYLLAALFIGEGGDVVEPSAGMGELASIGGTLELHKYLGISRARFVPVKGC